MTKEEMSKLPKINLDGIKSVMQSFDNIQKAAITPKISPDMFIKPETKMMAEIVEDAKEIKENSKPSPWLNIWTGVIVGLVVGILVLLVDNFLL